MEADIAAVVAVVIAAAATIGARPEAMAEEAEEVVMAADRAGEAVAAAVAVATEDTTAAATAEEEAAAGRAAAGVGRVAAAAGKVAAQAEATRDMAAAEVAAMEVAIRSARGEQEVEAADTAVVVTASMAVRALAACLHQTTWPRERALNTILPPRRPSISRARMVRDLLTMEPVDLLAAATLTSRPIRNGRRLRRIDRPKASASAHLATMATRNSSETR